MTLGGWGGGRAGVLASIRSLSVFPYLSLVGKLTDARRVGCRVGLRVQIVGKDHKSVPACGRCWGSSVGVRGGSATCARVPLRNTLSHAHACTHTRTHAHAQTRLPLGRLEDGGIAGWGRGAAGKANVVGVGVGVPKYREDRLRLMPAGDVVDAWLKQSDNDATGITGLNPFSFMGCKAQTSNQRHARSTPPPFSSLLFPHQDNKNAPVE